MASDWSKGGNCYITYDHMSIIFDVGSVMTYVTDFTLVVCHSFTKIQQQNLNSMHIIMSMLKKLEDTNYIWELVVPELLQYTLKYLTQQSILICSWQVCRKRFPANNGDAIIIYLSCSLISCFGDQSHRHFQHLVMLLLPHFPQYKDVDFCKKLMEKSKQIHTYFSEIE